MMNETGGKYAIKSLLAAAQALKENKIDGLVTAPIHKKIYKAMSLIIQGIHHF
ncbi:MAG: 4-hydroxythreonine-4-phosphate dehydrogenase PdxA [Chitinophagaceae bacterium]